jgi:hypothetical protein
VHGLRNAPSDRAVGRNANDQGAFAGKKSHANISEPSGKEAFLRRGV